jgi:NitT/TauT family transport system substrate-binding protein/sulfonate transport system substrate-binding protein
MIKGINDMFKTTQMKEWFRRVLEVVLLLAVAVFSGTTAGSGPAKNGIALRVGFVNATSKIILGPEGWAVQKGLLAKELRKLRVTEIKYLGFPNGPDINEALAAGELDLGILGDTPAIVGKAAGLESYLVNFSAVGQNVWLVTKKNGPQSLADLKGQTVATSKGSYMHRYLLGLLKETGLSDKVTVVHLLPRDAEAALTRGDIAVYAAPTGTGPQLVKNGFPVIDEAAKHPDLLGTSVTVTTKSFLAKHKDIITKWNSIRGQAVADLKNHSGEYYKLVGSVTHYDLDVVTQSYNIDLYYPESFPAKGVKLLEGAKEFLHEQNLIKSKFKLADWAFNQK